jgi:predicted PurR-regulated permease PerM
MQKTPKRSLTKSLTPAIFKAMSDITKQELHVKISPSIVIFTFLFIASIWLAIQIKAIIFMTFIAYIISVGLNKGIDKLEKKFKMSRVLGVLIVYLLFIALLSVFIAFIFPPLIKELTTLLSNIQLPNIFQDEFKNFEVNLTSIKGLFDTFGTSLTTAFTVISSTFSGAFVALTTMIIALYFSLEKPHIISGFADFFDNDKIEEIKDFLHEVDNQLGNWIRGEMILMTIIGLMTFIGLIILKIPYALPLAIIAGLLEIIPSMGPILSAVPAVIVAFLGFGWPMALAVTVLYIVIQQFEGNLIVPKVMKTNVNINPLVSILGILIGAKLFGVIGALLAVPIFIVCRTVFITWKKYLR